MATPTPERPRRGWLWLAVSAICAVALLVGVVLRAGTHGGGAEVVMVGLLAACAALFLLGEVLTVLQAVQAREAAAEALRALPPGYRVSGRIRIRGAGRPVVVDHLVVDPWGRARSVTVDGSTTSPRPGDPADGLARLLPVARRAAAALERAGRAKALPPELGLKPGQRVQPCILVARRPLSDGLRQGVLAFAAADALRVLGAASGRDQRA